MRLTRRTLLLSALLIAGCDSKVTQSLDTDVQNKVTTVTECMSGPFAVFKELVDFAELWRLNGGNDPADPAELTWSEQGNGTINYSIALTGFTLSGVISFYESDGSGPLDLSISTVSLSQAIDDAATLMGADAFIVGTWTVTDTGGAAVESGTGALTGIIGGSTNQNELEEVRTTTATPSGTTPFFPPNATGSVTVVEGGETCTLTFDTPHAPATVGLRTDDSPTQQYPIGTLHITLQGATATVEADLVFDGTVVAQLTVTGVGGHFNINLETQTVTAVP